MKKIYFILIVFLAIFLLVPQVDAASDSQKLKGRILLQVEKNGEAWYVNPANLKRYSMGRPDEAFNLMRQLGVGINNSNLAKIPVADANLGGADSDGDGLSDVIEESIGSSINNRDTDGDGYDDKAELLNGYSPIVKFGNKITDANFARKHFGKIFLQVEKNGEAWYVNPIDGKRYFLSRPTDAFQVMRNLGLGISNNDLTKIVANNQITAEKLPQGSAKLIFLNKLTGKLIPGHSVYCTGCHDVSVQNPAESDINGEVVIKPKADVGTQVAKIRIDWNNYDIIKDIKAGETRVIEVIPQVVGATQEIFFPETTYTKNSENKTQLHLTYKDASGKPKATSLVITGPIFDSKRTSLIVNTDSNGKNIVDLPLNGAYRISVTREVGNVMTKIFFQFEAPTGYNVNLDLDLGKTDQMVDGTDSLSKNYKERGMILVCVREKGTNAPMYSSVSIPNSNSLFTGTSKHNDDICVEVPKAYKTIGIPATGLHGGHPNVSTAGVDENDILYLYVTAK